MKEEDKAELTQNPKEFPEIEYDDLSSLPKEEIKEMCDQLCEEVTKALMFAFYSFGLKDGFVQISNNTSTGEEFVLMYRKTTPEIWKFLIDNQPGKITTP